MNDDFGDRMKFYESQEDRRFLPMLPIVARLDGRSFSKFTKKMLRPYDARLSELMVATTLFLCEESNALMGYTQSDEITLTWKSPRFDSEIFFAGRIQKMVSTLSAMATGFFVKNYENFFESPLGNVIPTFDCRAWSVPNVIEGANTFLWREQDASKNSISMAARTVYSHNELHGKNGSQMQEMLFAKGINWNDYPSFFKRGTFVQKKTTLSRFTTGEIENLPESHEARKNPDMVVERSAYVKIDMPQFSSVANRPEVIYDGADPQKHESSGEDSIPVPVA